MTPQDQIIAIAELDGWSVVTNHNNYFDINKEEFCIVNLLPHMLENNLPPYLTSRDAIIPVIEKQDWATQVNIAAHVCVMRNKQDFGEPASSRIHTMLATPPQLCEALLRACGKWKE